MKTAAVEQGGMSVVNMAARQRMLSQRLTLQIVLAAQGRPGMAEAAQKSLDLFVSSQQLLVQRARDESGEDGRLLQSVYFAPGDVARSVEVFIRDAQNALSAVQRGSSEMTVAVDRLVGGFDAVLDGLNRATAAFDQVVANREVAVMKELKGIVTEIQAVAREAKVVSFNALVIAARAGQAGREFSVVANTLASISGVIDNLAFKGLRLSSS